MDFKGSAVVRSTPSRDDGVKGQSPLPCLALPYFPALIPNFANSATSRSSLAFGVVSSLAP